MNGIDETLNESSRNEPWESGALGRDAAHARRVPVDVEQAVDSALAMKLVTMRLPVPMIEALKMIAEHYGIGYQPMVRDLLGRFIASEIPMILSQINDRATESATDRTAAVDSFMERKRACG